MTKRICFAALAIIVFFGVFVFAACENGASEDEFPSGSYILDYKLSSDGTYYTVTCAAMDTESRVLIPAEHEGKPVKALGADAFGGFGNYLLAVSMPEGLTEIGESAFFMCTSLEKITVPATVKTIGDKAFSYCRGLTEVTIPDGVQTLGQNAFLQCDGLKTINIAGSVKTISAYAFNFCSRLENLVLGEGIETIENQIIVGCNSLKSVVIPGSVGTLYGTAFENENSVAVCYAGTEAEFAEVTVKGNMSQTVYFYSDGKPASEGNYWHYVGGKPVLWQ